MNKQILIRILLFAVVARVGVIFADECPAMIQLTHFSPNICYVDFDGETCIDQCATALPKANPSCFVELSLPCGIRDGLFTSAASRQQQGNDIWVHITDLISFPALRSELHLVRNTLFQTLYRDYVAPPDLTFSIAGIQVKKDNFRLLLFSQVKAMLAPLKEAAGFRRLSLGLALEPGINASFAHLLGRVNNYPLYTVTEKNDLLFQLDQLRREELVFWEFLKLVSPNQVKQSRIAYLNDRLRELVQNINRLSGAKRDYNLTKIQALEQLRPFQFRECIAGICFDEIAVGVDDFYAGRDQQLTQVELVLNKSIKESAALEHTVGLNPTPGQYPYPDFYEIVNTTFSAYIADPSIDNLRRLESAIDIAVLQQAQDGLDFYEQLKVDAVAEIQGQVFLSPYANRKILLCQELDEINSRLKEIVEETTVTAEQARLIITQMIEQGHTPELLAQLEAMVQLMQSLSLESQRLSDIDRFSTDRHLDIVWNFNAQSQQFSTNVDRIELEFLAYDSSFWTSAFPAPLLRLVPAIAEIATVKGSLLPSGVGQIAGLKTLTMKLRQSAYSSCSPANNTIKLAVRVTNSDGLKQRYILKAVTNPL